MNLMSDLRRLLQTNLSTNSITYDPNADVPALLKLALNHEMKNVRPTPRYVFTSAEFEQKRLTLDSIQQQALADILGKFARGEDVSGHLSKGSARPEETDSLLADWDIFHLHISNHKANPTDKFFVPTGPVIFVHIADSSAYFIDIYSHGPGFPETWTRQGLLDTVDRSWPQLLDPFAGQKSLRWRAHHPTSN